MPQSTLIVYYSHSGNTEKIARLIQQETGGDLYEVQPEKPYPTDYNTVVAQAKQEIRKGFQPALKPNPVDLACYDIIFVGTPNWWSTIAPPITAFLSNHDLSGKTVVPFCTHGGGGLAGIAKDISRLCPDAAVLQSLAISGNGGTAAPAKIADWIQKIGLKK